MKCRVCGAVEGAWLQRRADGTTQWRPVHGPVYGDREWLPGQLIQVLRNGACTGAACQKQAQEKQWRRE